MITNLNMEILDSIIQYWEYVLIAKNENDSLN